MKNIFVLFVLFSVQTWALDSYQQDCHVIGDDDYVTTTIEATPGFENGSAFNLKLTAYEDENCATPYLQYNQYFHIARRDQDQLDLQTEKVTYAPLSDETTDALNMIQYCDQSNWTVHSELDITGKTCEDFQQLKADQLLFQILKTADDQIQIGKITSEQDARSEKTRPTEFDLGFHHVGSAAVKR